MTNDAERVSDIVAVEAVERIWDFLAPLRQREKGMEISAVFIARMKELEASDQSARDLLNEQDYIIEAQSKALAEAREALRPAGNIAFNMKQTAIYTSDRDNYRRISEAIDTAIRSLTPTPENPNGRA